MWPFQAKKSKKGNIKKPGDQAAFERAFTQRLGRDPITYIEEKLQAHNDLLAVRSLFDIIAAEIALKHHCVNPCFDIYYEIAKRRLATEKAVLKSTRANPSAEFAHGQLIGGSRFIQQYDSQLKALADNSAFLNFICKLRDKLPDQDQADIRAINRTIADYFYHGNANHFPEVKAIVDGITAYGKQSSAHISIYYAIFLYRNDF